MKFKNLAKIRPPKDVDLIFFINDNSELSVVSGIFENDSIITKNFFKNASEEWTTFISMDDLLYLERIGHIDGIEFFWTELSEFEEDADISDDITYELLTKQNIE